LKLCGSLSFPIIAPPYQTAQCPEDTHERHSLLQGSFSVMGRKLFSRWATGLWREEQVLMSRYPL
ncbi:mCG122811, isoform CRA_c, partial [Mus musculus]